MGGMQHGPQALQQAGPLAACCICLFACAFAVAALVYLVWCIVAVANGSDLQHASCPGVAEVWWTVTAMLIIQAANMCVLPCIFGWEQYKMSQDAAYARAMQKPLLVLHLFIVSSEAWFVFIYGLLAWRGISDKCKAVLTKKNGDLWVLFQITVVLWSISAVFMTCAVCILGGAVLAARGGA